MKANLSSTNIAAYDKHCVDADTKSTSPSSSPRYSPNRSPKPQNKNDDLKVEQNNEPLFNPNGSTSSQDGSKELVSSGSSTERMPPQHDSKIESSISLSKERRGARGKKKTSWFNPFYPSYKSRSEDFKKLFKDIPDDERLVVDYSCALQKEILQHGRLYVTQNFICFYANIFGWETNLTLKWKEITAITKEKTALVIPNAILISNKTEKYFFTSFVARDKAYLLLFRVWQNALMDQPMTAQEMWTLVHQWYGSELGLTSEDEDYISPCIEEDNLSVGLSVESFSEKGINDVKKRNGSLEEELKQKTDEIHKHIRDLESLQEVNAELLGTIRTLEMNNITYSNEVVSLKNTLTHLQSSKENPIRELTSSTTKVSERKKLAFINKPSHSCIRKKILIVSTVHGKGMAEAMSKHTEEYSILSFVKPHAPDAELVVTATNLARDFTKMMSY
ncbi:hypothetical protein JTB14_014369 [Gonioctena quinquepunctata]|nr:hypothetical protein JTB14_014369 [Gonioctena quinquepunctata]